MAPPLVSPPDLHSLTGVRLVGLEPDVLTHLGQKQKTNAYIENTSSGPTTQIRQRLHFNRATFVAFSGALAEELTCFCRRAQTE